MGCAVLAGAALRFYGLGGRDFWFDESCTFIYVRSLFCWPDTSDLLRESTNLPYYFVLRGWVAVFGESEAAYRALSAFCATLTIPVLSLAARRLGGPPAGVVCAVVVALHPLHVYYAHEARAYALWVLLLSIALWLVINAALEGGWKWWAAYAVALLACLHVHYFTLYWLPASIACVLLDERRGRAFRRWVVAHAAVGLLFLPYFCAAVWPAGRGGGGAWLSDESSAENLFALIPRSLWAFLPAGGYPAHLRGLSLLAPDTVRAGPDWLAALARWLPAVTVAGIGSYLVIKGVRMNLWGPCGIGVTKGFHLHRRSQENHPDTFSTHVFLAGMTVLPLCLACAYSVLVRFNYLVARYDLVAWPAFVVWTAVVIAAFSRTVSPGRAGRAALAICLPLALCAAVPNRRMAALKPPPTFHNLRAQRLAEIAGKDDLVVAFSYDRDYLLYCLDRAHFAGRIVSFPSWLDDQIGWVDTAADRSPEKAEALGADADSLVGEIEKAVDRGNTVWLLGDSHERGGDWPRTSINRRLITALAESGYEGEPFDMRYLIYRVRRASVR